MTLTGREIVVLGAIHHHGKHIGIGKEELLAHVNEELTINRRDYPMNPAGLKEIIGQAREDKLIEFVTDEKMRITDEGRTALGPQLDRGALVPDQPREFPDVP